MVKTWGDETNPKWSTLKAKEVRERERNARERKKAFYAEEFMV